MRETLPRPTDLPHAQCQLPQAIATLTTIEESIIVIPSSWRRTGYCTWTAQAGEGLRDFGLAEVLVDRFPADPKITGKEGLWNTAAGALNEFGRPFRGERLFPSFVGAALLGQRDPFPLAFPNEGAFEFSKGSHNAEHEVCQGGVLAGEDQALFNELHPHTFAREVLDQGTQVIKVPG